MSDNGLNTGAACKQCGAVLEEVDALLSAAAARERTINALKNELMEKRDTHKHRETVVRIADYWNAQCRNGKARAAAKGERFDKTAARLGEGWTEEELLRAVDGAAAEPTVINGRTYDDLKTIMKSASSVEAHVNRAPSLDDLLDKTRDRLALLPVDAAVVERQKALRGQVSDWLGDREDGWARSLAQTFPVAA